MGLNERNRTGNNKIRGSLAALLWVLTGWFLYIAVWENAFGGTVWDRGIYGLGALLLAVLGSRLIGRLSLPSLQEAGMRQVLAVNLLQVCCFACICLMTLYYYNSGSEYGHSVATRVMNGAFGIALLSLYPLPERQTAWIGYAQAVATALFAAVTLGRAQDSKMLLLYTLSVIVVWIYSKLLLLVAGRAGRRALCTHFSLYGWLVWMLLAGMVIFRNTRTWPFSVAIPFGCLYLHRFDKAGMDRFLKNFCHGCMLAFWLMLGSAALFRPYYSFEFVRYPGWFSSVATAGLFWMLVFACTISCMMAKLRAGGTLSVREVYLEWLTLGADTAYLLMTLSRTAALSVAVFSLAAFVLSQLWYYRDSVREMGKKLLLVISPVLLIFPVVYTITRCVPAIVGRPIWITGAEWFSDRIEKKEAMDSTKYMNIAQLGETFLEKWLGVDINLTEIVGAVSGPGDRTVEENGEVVFHDNVVSVEERDGQLYTVKDYTFYNPDTDDVSNGRFDLFSLYYEHLNATGHDSMLVEDAGDIALYHAHNSYMQVAYDHGVFVGILFLAVTAGGMIVSVLYYKRMCREVSFAIYPVVVVISFMIAGITEWIFHPSIPIGFAFLIALTPLMPKREEKLIEADAIEE